MVYPVERVQLLQKTEFSICLPNDVISQHCKSWHFKSRKQLLKVVKPGVNYLTDYSVICQTWNWFWHNTEHACHLFQILQWFFQWLFAYFNNCLLHLPTWNWFWHTCHLFQQLHHQLTSITRVSDVIGGGFILKPLPPHVLCGLLLGRRKYQIELTSRLRGHVCLLACCSSLPPPTSSTLPPPPTSPPWWLLLILLLLLLVHVCVPTSLGVFDDPGDAAPAFPSPQLHNSLLAPRCSLLATAVILLLCVDFPTLPRFEEVFKSQAIPADER